MSFIFLGFHYPLVRLFLTVFTMSCVIVHENLLFTAHSPWPCGVRSLDLDLGSLQIPISFSLSFIAFPSVIKHSFAALYHPSYRQSKLTPFSLVSLFISIDLHIFNITIIVLIILHVTSVISYLHTLT